MSSPKVIPSILSTTPYYLYGGTSAFLFYSYYAHTLCQNRRAEEVSEDEKYRTIKEKFLNGQSIPKTMKQLEEQNAVMVRVRKQRDDCKTITEIYRYFIKEK